MRKIPLLALLMIAAVAPRAAAAVTVKDIMDLARAGLGDEVLLALVEVDGSVFSIDTKTLTALKSAGVTDRVIAAMIRSGRPGPFDPQLQNDAPPPPVPDPPVVIVEQAPPQVVQVAVPVAVPVYVPVRVRERVRDRAIDTDLRPTAPVTVPRIPYVTDIPPTRTERPVYWGWGGKRRPDAWKDN